MIVLGGTITMMPEPQGGIVPALDGAMLIAAVPQLADIAAITVETPFLVPGASLSFAQLRQVSQRIAAAIASGAQGVVVVQGTDTIDETAFLLGSGPRRRSAAGGHRGHAQCCCAGR